MSALTWVHVTYMLIPLWVSIPVAIGCWLMERGSDMRRP